MGSFPWGVALAVFGVVVPAIAFLYEFVFVGRKRLGYRVQVDTTATGEVPSQYAGALQQLQQNGTRLIDPSFVLLRIENNGATHIDTSDYAVLDDDKDSTAGSREPFKAPEIVGGIKCPLACATGELTLTGSCTTGCKRCPHISRHNAPAPNPTDNEREQLPVLECRRRGVYDAFMPSLMLHFVVCRVFGSLQPLMVNALMRLSGATGSRLLDQALAALIEQLETERELAALVSHPYEEDPDLAWEAPPGPDLPYEGAVPDDVLELAQARRRSRRGG